MSHPLDGLSKRALYKILHLLQRAHNHWEIQGYDILTYGSAGGPACIIGGARIAAGCKDAYPPGYKKTAEGDGAELAPALQLLDHACALTRHPGVSIREARHEVRSYLDEPKEEAPGRLAETLGFAVRRSLGFRNHETECRWLVQCVRRALREVHERIEAGS